MDKSCLVKEGKRKKGLQKVLSALCLLRETSLWRWHFSWVTGAGCREIDMQCRHGTGISKPKL